MAMCGRTVREIGFCRFKLKGEETHITQRRAQKGSANGPSFAIIVGAAPVLNHVVKVLNLSSPDSSSAAKIRPNTRRPSTYRQLLHCEIKAITPMKIRKKVDVVFEDFRER